MHVLSPSAWSVETTDKESAAKLAWVIKLQHSLLRPENISPEQTYFTQSFQKLSVDQWRRLIPVVYANTDTWRFHEGFTLLRQRLTLLTMSVYQDCWSHQRRCIMLNYFCHWCPRSQLKKIQVLHDLHVDRFIKVLLNLFMCWVWPGAWGIEVRMLTYFKWHKYMINSTDNVLTHIDSFIYGIIADRHSTNKYNVSNLISLAVTWYLRQ